MTTEAELAVYFLDTTWHSAFLSTSQPIDVTRTKNAVHRDEWPGFWYTVDKDGEVVRCGCARNAKKAMDEFEPWSTEVTVRVFLSHRCNEKGFRNMKNYKQQFKREISGKVGYKY